VKRTVLGVILSILMVSAVQAEQAPRCVVEDTNLQMVERDRKALERKAAMMAALMQEADARLLEMAAELKTLKKDQAAQKESKKDE